MKTIEIGNKKYQQCETAEDLPIKRYAPLKHYMIYKESGVTVPSLIKAMSGFIKGFDEESKAKMLISLHNYATGLQQTLDEFDPDQMVFALITFEDGEDKHIWDETKAKDKLEKWNKDGLTQGVVEDAVVNFIEASTTHFVTSLKMNLQKDKRS